MQPAIFRRSGGEQASASVTDKLWNAEGRGHGLFCKHSIVHLPSLLPSNRTWCCIFLFFIPKLLLPPPNSFLSFIPTTMLLTRDLAEEQNSVHVVVRRGRRKAEGLVCVNMIQFTGSNINNQINSFQRVYQCMQICGLWLLIAIHFRRFCVNNELVVGGFCNTNKHVSQ